MKRIILLRHAKTEPYDYNKDDFERNLVARGISDCHIITNILKQKNYKPQYIFASPSNRTKQTAALFAKDLAIAKENISYYRQIYDGMTTQDLINLLKNTAEENDTILFIGHNPDISRFAYRLTKDFQHYVPTCCAIVLETESSTWKDLGKSTFNFTNIFTPKNYK